MNGQHEAVASSSPYTKDCASWMRVSVFLPLLAAACGGGTEMNSHPLNDTPSVTGPAPAASAGSAAAGRGGSAAAPTAPASAGRSAPQNPGSTTPMGPTAAGTPASTPPVTNTPMTLAARSAGSNGAAGAGPAAPPSAADSGDAMGAPAANCLDSITDYTSMGPFDFELKMDGSVFMWVPMVPAGCKVPVTHLANGTGAGCMNYEEINGFLASHGFLASCYDNGNTGAGDQGIMALEKVYELYPDLADKKIGSTGHSQGGQASFIVLQYAETKFGADFKYAGLAMEPASGFGSQPTQGSWSSIYAMIKSPMFMFHGTADTLVASSWVGQAYNAMGDTEVYWWSAIGATHVPTPDAHTQQVAVPWFRWKLLGDKKACEAFKALPDTDQWDAVESKNEAPCE